MKKMLSLALGAALALSWAPALSYGAGLLFVDDSGNVGIGNITPAARLDVSGSIYSRIATTTASVNWTAGNVQTITLTSNQTLTFSNGQAGGEYKLILTQDGTGGRTVTWPASVKWEGSSRPTLSSDGDAKDIVSFVYDGTSYLSSAELNFGNAAECSGGSITHSGGNTIHTFTSSGTLDCTNNGSKTANILVVGGGGGGGAPQNSNGFAGGGGAGGGYQYSTSHSVGAHSYSVTVGAGGSGGTGGASPTSGSNGSDSIFDSITAAGGGGGGYDVTAGSHVGLNGGSGGGGGGQSSSSGGTGSQGNSGGSGLADGLNAGGGGGGSSGAGGNATDSSGTGLGGNGGSGTANSISGSSVTYAGGGGGGSDTTAGTGGSGGGGTGGLHSNGTNGTANTGGGGGGGASNANTVNGGAGGSGIVIISYPTP
jgi:hypothetical protein